MLWLRLTVLVETISAKDAVETATVGRAAADLATTTVLVAVVVTEDMKDEDGIDDERRDGLGGRWRSIR